MAPQIETSRSVYDETRTAIPIFFLEEDIALSQIDTLKNCMANTILNAYRQDDVVDEYPGGVLVTDHYRWLEA